MVSVASLLNHVPSESIHQMHLPPSPLSASSSNCASTAPSSTSSSPATNDSSLALNRRLAHNSSVYQANGQANTDISSLNGLLHSTTLSNNLGFGSQVKKQKMSKDGAVFLKGKVKGDVNFPPFENLDEHTTSEVLKFHVYPLGRITEYCRHIPYNSEKKTFLEKTGRESFEVFQYIFRVPDDEKDYTVMWDYNTGLVRITPFFKSCKFSKTTPAKMLSLNPGSKDITHSITGGALVAQGYWMPFACARAVCATFCYHIAPALIPIFGPAFPSCCVVPEAPEYGRFSIDPAIVIECTKEAERYRLLYSSGHAARHSRNNDARRSETRMLSPRSTPTEMRTMESRDIMEGKGRERDSDVLRKERGRRQDYEHDHREIRTPLPSTSYLGKRLRLNSKKTLGHVRSDSPYPSASTDTDMEYTSESSSDRFRPSPFTPSSEKSSVLSSRSNIDLPYIPAITPPRTNTELPSPWLTAIPGGRLTSGFSDMAGNSSYSHLAPSYPSTAHFQCLNSHAHATNNKKSVAYTPHTHQQQVQPLPSTPTSVPQTLCHNAVTSSPSPSSVEEGNTRSSQWRPKRRIAEFLDRSGAGGHSNETDEGYDGEHEESASSASGSERGGRQANGPAISGGILNDEVAERKAAWLLMNLSVRDAGFGGGSDVSGERTRKDVGGLGGGGGGRRDGLGLGLGLRMGGGAQLVAIGGGDGSADIETDGDGPRVKRRRALSM